MQLSAKITYSAGANTCNTFSHSLPLKFLECWEDQSVFLMSLQNIIQTWTRPAFTSIYRHPTTRILRAIFWGETPEWIRVFPYFLPFVPMSAATAGSPSMGKHLSLRKTFSDFTVKTLGPVALDRRWSALSAVPRETCSMKSKKREQKHPSNFSVPLHLELQPTQKILAHSDHKMSHLSVLKQEWNLLGA